MRKRGYLGIYGYGLRVPLQKGTQLYVHWDTLFYIMTADSR